MTQKKEEQLQHIGQVNDISITKEMEKSYIDYAMSVIVSRALPDVRDGLKPVQRRILYTMYEEGLAHNTKYRKSATAVGSVLGRYHPHSDTAVYDALARMAQDFSLRYPLIDGQGNFGCFTKDTKVKLTDGRSLSFEKLVEEYKKGKKHWTFSFNPQSKKIEIVQIKHPRKTRINEKVIEITLDNKEKIKCTLDHKFMLRDGSYKEAKDLKPRDSLMPAYFNEKRIRSHYNYLAVMQPFTGCYSFVYRLADEFNVRNKKKKKVQGKYILHHKDFNKFNNSPDNIERLTVKEHYKVHLDQAKNLWKEKGDEFREKHINSLKKTFSNPVLRKKISERSKKLWKDPSYRAKYSENHFQKMSEKLWQKPGIKEFHREKINKQRQNEEFRKKHLEAVKVSNLLRLGKNPNMMKEMTAKAKISLCENWQTPNYKERVIRGKILGYVSSLLSEHSKVTSQTYEKERINNGVPRLENALKYFNSFSEILSESKKYNHKIVETKILQKREDMYDLTTEPHHNFLLAAGVFVHNSIDNDPPAAQRYTECRLSKIGGLMLRDISKDTIDFTDNYDGTRKEPVVLPAPVPGLLLNGTLGIAVGMATNIPPHNLREVVDAAIYLVDNPEATTEDLFKFVKGPDFPTGGIIFDQKEMVSTYSQGKGPIIIRGKADIIEKDSGRSEIIITEIPYQVQKSNLVKAFASLAQLKKIKGIKDIRDESDKDGLRIVIELSRESFPRKVLNRLYKFTDLQKTFHLNMIALVDGIQPRVLSLKEVIRYYLIHKEEVVVRRLNYELKKAKERSHILEGLHKCLSNIDEVIAIIKKSADRETAKNNLMKRFKLTEIQSNAILETKLSALAKLERQKIEDELNELMKKIKSISEVLASPKKIKTTMKDELEEVKEDYGDERRTKSLVRKVEEIAEKDLIPQEETIIVITKGGYIKRVKPDIFKIQHRGGKGILGMKTIQDDIVDHFLFAKTHDELLFFTDSGKVFKVPAYEIPEANRSARGRGVSNFLEITSEDKILSLLSYRKEEDKEKNLIMVTEKGIIKKTSLKEFENVRKSGLIAMSLKKGDSLKVVRMSTGCDEVNISTEKGIAIKFNEKDIRPMGRPAAGVKGIDLKTGDKVVGMDVITMIDKKEKKYLLILTENGYGKRTEIDQYRLQKRGGKGIKAAKITSKTGDIVLAKVISGDADLIVISQKGQVIRTSISSVSILGRDTQGVRTMRLKDGDKIASAIYI